MVAAGKTIGCGSARVRPTTVPGQLRLPPTHAPLPLGSTPRSAHSTPGASTERTSPRFSCTSLAPVARPGSSKRGEPVTPVRAPGGPTQQQAYLPDSTGHLRPNTAESTAIAVSTEAPLAPKTLLPRPPIPSSPRAQRSSNSVPSSDTSTTADVPRAASALEASPLPSYTISAAETRPGMGGRQASRRLARCAQT